jgi:hypothetical protein
LVPDQATYYNLFEDELGIVEIAGTDAFYVGDPITSGATLACAAQDPSIIYLLTQGQKRWIKSEQVFNLFDFWAKLVRAMDAETLANIPSGLPISIPRTLAS